MVQFRGINAFDSHRFNSIYPTNAGKQIVGTSQCDRCLLTCSIRSVLQHDGRQVMGAIQFK